MSSKIKNILFRADSSSTIGTGHIMRDLVLAQKYAKKGINIIFATQNLNGNINYKILEAKFKLEIIKYNSKKELVRLINKLKIDMLVIDHYGIGYKKEKYIKEKTGIKILSFDDTYKKHYCDILLNHNISGNKKKYKNLVPKNCKLRCGSKYALLRKEFIKEKNKIYKPNKKFTFFVAMGGADTTNINIKILKVLKQFKDIKVNLVTTSANKNLEKLKSYCQNKKWVKLCINSTTIARLMNKSDCTIVTPSVIANEAYYLNLKIIVIKTANNQNDIYKYLKNKSYSALSDFKSSKFKNKLYKIL
jgi:UDP-2,4-diacetamido-2,4,6-trideoxy-beta-L-altropyranose hydrolase